MKKTKELIQFTNYILQVIAKGVGCMERDNFQPVIKKAARYCLRE